MAGAQGESLARGVAWPGNSRLRLLLFANPFLPSSMTLLAATLRVAVSRSDVDVVGVVDTATRRLPEVNRARARAGKLARRVLNPGLSGTSWEPPPTGCASVAEGFGVPLLSPGSAGVNSPAFVAEVRSALRPDAALALMVDQIFRAPLLDACRTSVNYHNGWLPDYRGIGVTEWSLYREEAQSGFTFHYMSDLVDGGPILLEGAVPIDDSSRPFDVERAKTVRAVAELPRLLDLVVAGAEGEPQEDEAGATFTRAELEAIRRCDPATLTLEELRHRVRAFEWIEPVLAGERQAVTAVRPVARSGSGATSFTTADGIQVRPSRIKYLPPAIHRAARSLARR